MLPEHILFQQPHYYNGKLVRPDTIIDDFDVIQAFENVLEQQAKKLALDDPLRYIIFGYLIKYQVPCDFDIIRDTDLETHYEYTLSYKIDSLKEKMAELGLTWTLPADDTLKLEFLDHFLLELTDDYIDLEGDE